MQVLRFALQIKRVSVLGHDRRAHWRVEARAPILAKEGRNPSFESHTAPSFRRRVAKWVHGREPRWEVPAKGLGRGPSD